MFEGGNALDAQFAAATLIGESGVGKPITHHPLPSLQGRLNHSLKMLGARGKHEQGFALKTHGLMQQERTQLFAELGAARFAGTNDLHTTLSQLID